MVEGGWIFLKHICLVPEVDKLDEKTRKQAYVAASLPFPVDVAYWVYKGVSAYYEKSE